jgi:hypothetical protein
MALVVSAPVGDERREWKESERDRELVRRWRERGGSLLPLGDRGCPVERDNVGRPLLEGWGEIPPGD